MRTVSRIQPLCKSGMSIRQHTCSQRLSWTQTQSCCGLSAVLAISVKSSGATKSLQSAYLVMAFTEQLGLCRPVAGAHPFCDRLSVSSAPMTPVSDLAFSRTRRCCEQGTCTATQRERDREQNSHSFTRRSQSDVAVCKVICRQWPAKDAANA